MKEWPKLWRQNPNHNKLQLSSPPLLLLLLVEVQNTVLIQRDLFTSASRVKVKNDQTIPINSNDEAFFFLYRITFHY